MSFLGCRLCRAGKVLITGHRVAFTEKRPGVFSWKTFSLMPHAVHHPVLAQTSTRAGGELAASHGSAAWILCQEPPLGLRRRPLARRACMPSVPFTPTLYSARASEAHSCQRPDGMLSVCALCLRSLSVLSVCASVCALCLCPRRSLSLSLCYKSAGLANRAALATATPEPTATRAPWRLANLATPEAIAAASVAGGTPMTPRIGVP